MEDGRESYSAGKINPVPLMTLMALGCRPAANAEKLKTT